MPSKFLPHARQIAAINSAREMADLLQRNDLPKKMPSWWMVVISVCNTGMLSVEAGAEDAEQWAELLVQALDKARSLGGLGSEEIIHRRMMACAAALEYFGVQKGSEARDPELVTARFIAEFGSSPDAVINECQGIMNVPEGVQVGESAYTKIKWVSSMRKTLDALSRVAGFIEGGTQKRIIDGWCEMAYLIPDRRIFHK